MLWGTSGVDYNIYLDQFSTVFVLFVECMEKIYHETNSLICICHCLSFLVLFCVIFPVVVTCVILSSFFDVGVLGYSPMFAICDGFEFLGNFPVIVTYVVSHVCFLALVSVISCFLVKPSPPASVLYWLIACLALTGLTCVSSCLCPCASLFVC